MAGYDALQRQVTVTDPRIGPSLTHFNDKGQIDWTQDPAGNRTSYAYDPDSGRPFSKTDPLTNTTYTAYTLQGQEWRIWGGATYPVEYGYDAWNRQISQKTFRNQADWSAPTWPADAGQGDETTWIFEDATGLLLTKRYADNSEVTYTYTPDGKMFTRTLARRSLGEGGWAPLITTYGYSPVGDMTSVDYSDATPDVAYTHDRLGRQLTAGSSVSEHAFAYNANLQLESEVISSQSSGTNVFTRFFDPLGRSTGFSLTDNRAPVTDYQISYSHDPFGRFSSISSSVNSASSVVNYSYLPSSDLLSGYSNSLSGLTVTQTYEDYRNLMTEVHNQAAGVTISRFVYTNDALGRRVGRQDTGLAFAQPTPNAFGYNTRSELINADMGTNAFGYAYDPIGNRQAATNNGEALTYTANALNQYTQVADGFTNLLAYDLDGNLTNDGRWANTWDAENRLISVESLSLTNGAHKVDFQYDFQSRRVSKTAYSWDTDHWSLVTDHCFIYDGWNVIRDLKSTASSLQTNSYIWGLDLSGSLQGAGGIGGLLAVVRPDPTNSLQPKAYLATYDANGNVSEYLADDGEIVAHFEYGPYGQAVVATGPLANEFPIRFSTKPFDLETGLGYWGYRYYHPDLGRWLSRDPIGERGGLNLLNYCLNSSIRTIDPLGLAVQWKELGGEETLGFYNLYKSSSPGNPLVRIRISKRAGFMVWYEGNCDCKGNERGDVILVQYKDTGWIWHNWVPDTTIETPTWIEKCDDGIVVIRQPAYLDPNPNTGAGGVPGDIPGSYVDSPDLDQTFRIEPWCRCRCEDDRLLSGQTIYLHYRKNGKLTASTTP